MYGTLQYLNSNLVIIIVAIILSVLAVNYLYQQYLILKYPRSETPTEQGSLVNQSVSIFVLLGILWVIVFALITVDRGHWENMWGIFTVPVFGSFGVGCLWFFGFIRKYSNTSKWLLLLLGILFTTLYFPITLMRIVQSLIV